MRIKYPMVALLAGSALLGACGNGAGSGGADGDNVELSWWMVTQEASGLEALETIVEDYEEANPGVSIKLETRDIDPHKDSLRRTAGSSSGPDIYYMWAGRGLGGEFVEAGTSLDLTDYYEQYGWQDRFTEAVLANYTQYGGFHGVPWTQRAEAFYYNKALFEQAGITEEPATYDELVEAADKLEASGVTPIQFGGSVNWHVMRLLDSLIETKCGAETHDALTSLEASWADEACVTEAFTELKRWSDSYLQEGWIGVDNDESTQLFYAGQAAMALEGDWFVSQLSDAGLDPEEIGLFQIPTGTNRLYGFGEGMYINANSPDADEAAKFLDYLTSTEVQSAHSSAFAAISVNQEVEPAGDQPSLVTEFTELFETAEGTYVNNDQNFPLEITTEYWRIQNSVATGDIAPQDAGADLQKFIDARA